MSILQAIILGLAQGLTEFIPVSSSGHLVLLHQFMGISQNGLAFDVALHIGTLLALLLYFYKDVAELIKAVFIQNEKTKLAYLLIIATIPAVIVGMLLESVAESAFRSSSLVAVNLIVVALFMLLAESYTKALQHKTKLENIKTSQALTMGVVQAAAIVPGVSRSGSTIVAGLFSGLERVAATRFSFLLGIPITFGAILKVLTTSGSMQLIASEKAVFLVGILTAFVSGLTAIAFLLKYLAKHTLNIFAYYRIALGTLVFIIMLVR
jgi:undecaprenyl-diphosphatase